MLVYLNDCPDGGGTSLLHSQEGYIRFAIHHPLGLGMAPLLCPDLRPWLRIQPASTPWGCPTPGFVHPTSPPIMHKRVLTAAAHTAQAKPQACCQGLQSTTSVEHLVIQCPWPAKGHLGTTGVYRAGQPSLTHTFKTTFKPPPPQPENPNIQPRK